jgi:hypothetical protein
VGELTAAFAAAAEDSALVQVELAPVPIPLRRVVEAQLIDTVVHTWDIAQALGTDYTPGPVLAGAVVEIARGLPPTAYGPGAAFAPATALPGEPWGDTLALTGRIDRRRCPVPGFAV